MRVFFAATLIALLAGPAFAQMGTTNTKGGPPEPAPPKTQTQIEADRAAERAYSKSLGNIPDQAPADPWGGARNLGAPKASDKPASTKVGAGKKKPPA
jgi:hypothetical protein